MNYYTLKISLYEIEPTIWRKVKVCGSLTFAQLHHVIQRSMGWEDQESHEFRYGKGTILTDVIAKKGEDIVIEGAFTDESELTVDEFFKRRRLPRRLLYRYDFAEDWVHELAFEIKEELEAGELVAMMAGERACPPESSGGSWGYMNALEGSIEWMDDNYDPEVFDMASISFTL